MKHITISLLTFGMIGFVNWTVSSFVHARFIDYPFFVGLVCVLLIKFFTSSGGFGFTTNLARLHIQAQTGMKIAEEKQPYQPSIAFYAAIGSAVISLIATFYYYKDYFLK
jgi:hypothetical protein